MVLIILLLSIMGAQAARLAVPADMERLHSLPVNAIKHIPRSVLQGRVFNEYSFGGPLIFFGIKPFIDGRADMYGDDLVKDYLAVERGDPEAVDRVFSHYGIRWTILRPKSPLNKFVKAKGWRRVYSDERAMIHIIPNETAVQRNKSRTVP